MSREKYNITTPDEFGDDAFLGISYDRNSDILELRCAASRVDVLDDIIDQPWFRDIISNVDGRVGTVVMRSMYIYSLRSSGVNFRKLVRAFASHGFELERTPRMRRKY